MAFQYADPTAGNALRRLITDPSSFSGTPGFNFTLNTALDNVGRQAAARGMNVSGNVLGDLTRTASGIANQDYMGMLNSLGQISGQDQQFEAAQTGNANTAARNANDFTLGTQRNNIDQQNNENQYNLGMYRATNDYDLGLGVNQNTANRNQNDFILGGQHNANEAANNENQYNLGMFDANTRRGNSLADIYFRGQAAQPHTFNINGRTVTTMPRFT